MAFSVVLGFLVGTGSLRIEGNIENGPFLFCLGFTDGQIAVPQVRAQAS